MIGTLIDIEDTKTPQEKFYKDLSSVDRLIYGGAYYNRCLCGQLALRYPDFTEDQDVVFFLAKKYPYVSTRDMESIFQRASTFPYYEDVDKALEMAKTILGLNLDNT